jgi:hypothetical protein
VAGSQSAGEIYGRITDGGAPAVGVMLTLWLWNGSSWSDVARVDTKSDGSYSFPSPESLGPNETYEVVYGPNDADESHLYSWTGPTVSVYLKGAQQAGGTFDIANVALLAPPPDTVVGLPATLSWQRRGLGSDTYQVLLFDFDAGEEATFDEEGNSGSVTITQLPEWAAFGEQYGWTVWVCNDANGCGDAFQYRTITFTE